MKFRSSTGSVYYTTVYKVLQCDSEKTLVVSLVMIKRVSCLESKLLDNSVLFSIGFFLELPGGPRREVVMSTFMNMQMLSSEYCTWHDPVKNKHR